MEIYHYSIIDLFKRIGADLGYLPIKEFSLMNIGEITEERIDLVWIKNSKVEYAFEFETARDFFVLVFSLSSAAISSTSSPEDLTSLPCIVTFILYFFRLFRKSIPLLSPINIASTDSKLKDFLTKKIYFLIFSLSLINLSRKKIEHIAEHGNTK